MGWRNELKRVAELKKPQIEPQKVLANIKTIDQHFADWESHVFGCGYGSGEEHTIAALKTFMATVGEEHNALSYEYAKLEAALTPTVAWLLINTLCKADIIEYGTSPRYAWLTAHGARLKQYVDAKSVADLCISTDNDESYGPCSPSACNCGPQGYDAKIKCNNPFWK
jgi:hypothetical protein